MQTVEVSREDYNDGAGGFDYLITFTGNDGKLELLNGTDFDLKGTGYDPQGGTKTAQILSTKVDDGNFIGGSFSVSLASKTRKIDSISNANEAVVTSFGHGFVNGDYVRFSCSPDWGNLDSKNYIVKSATTNTFIVDFNSASLGSFAGLATAEKVVTVSEITKADYALVRTHGDHGFTNATHKNDFVAFFDLKLATGLNNKKYRIKYVVDDKTIALDWNSTGISQAESCSDATCGVIRLATEDLDAAVSAGDMKTALQGLDGFGTMSVSRAKDAESPSWTGGYMWLITFESLPGDIGKMLIATQQMTGDNAIVTVGDANDTPLQSGSERDANQIGGTFVVKTHDGNRTADLPYGITKEDMQDALNSILGANSVLVSRNAPGVPGDNVANIGPAGGYTWKVEFSHSRVGGDVPMLLVEANNITGIGTSLVVTEDVKATN